jgi:Tol biopolymer transport system component
VIISDPTSRSRTSITLPGFAFRVGPTVRWSPDGRRLAVLYGDMEDGNEVLAVVDRDTPNVDKLVHASEGEEIRWPAWAQDSRHIYFRSSRQRSGGPGWDHSIRRVTLASGFPVEDVDLEGLLPGAAGPIDVAPDGSIAMRHLRPGKCVVRIVPPSGEAFDRHEFTGGCTALAWSRDGSSLAVATQTGPASEADYSLWIMQRAKYNYGRTASRSELDFPWTSDIGAGNGRIASY